ncbi:MAG: polynucleotide adenylyltransferase [Candidatus Adlerbacteria bacterium]|nr:polynucleotide adenylyltransferase [Candidatus Adlerbacteria bacterium]
MQISSTLIQGQIPPEVSRVTSALSGAGYEAWVVGGCVRDLLLKRTPKDWDVTTNANPETIQGLFENTFYTNEFGTVGVVNDEVGDETLKVIEVTPYRTEGAYSDARRPDHVEFSQDIKEDLKRRDFTINAIAFNPASGELLDLYEGQKDLELGLIRAVGNARERFQEDALRIMRAVRLAAELGFAIEPETELAMGECAAQLGKISKERIRDEFVRIINSPQPMKALYLAQTLGILGYIAPEIEKGIGVDQNQAHSFDVFEHNMRALQHAADKRWPFIVRLSALFHDIGKPKARRWSEEKHDWTFHGHEVIGARMTKKALEELKFSRETIDTVTNLVRWHMFFSDPDKVTLSAVRRIVRNVSPDHIWDLVNLRICDRIGTGRPKEQPFRLRKYQAMIEQALRDPISVGMLAINGKRLMDVTHEKPGPRLGWMLHALLEEVLEDPSKNTADYMEQRAQELAAMKDADLRALGEEGKEKKEEFEEAEVKDIHKKYFVD